MILRNSPIFLLVSSRACQDLNRGFRCPETQQGPLIQGPELDQAEPSETQHCKIDYTEKSNGITPSCLRHPSVSSPNRELSLVLCP